MNRWNHLQAIGCLACRQRGYYEEPSDCHHLLSGHVRRGDAFTIPLCPWHHRGLWHNRFAHRKLAESLLGPSLALEADAFRAAFGSDNELLEMANVLIEERENRVSVLRIGRTLAPVGDDGHLIVPTTTTTDKPRKTRAARGKK